MPPRRAKKEEEPDDEFMKMTATDLETDLKLRKERVADLKSKRNYIQMDRDMVEQFYHNTEVEIDEIQTDVLNK